MKRQIRQMGVNGKKKLFANPSFQNIYAVAFIFFTNPLKIFTQFTTLSSFLKIECIPSCHSNQYCWIAAIWEDWNEKKTKVKEKWNLSELQQLSQVCKTNQKTREWPVKKHNEGERKEENNEITNQRDKMGSDLWRNTKKKKAVQKTNRVKNQRKVT